MPDPHVNEGSMDVMNSRDDEIGGGNIALSEDIGSYGYGGDVRTWIERNYVIVEPPISCRAVGGDGRNE